MDGGAAPRRSRRSATDLLWVAAAPLLTFVVAARLELFERTVAATRRVETFEVDELLFAAAALVVALAWYAARRWREAVDARRSATALLVHNRELSQRLIVLQEDERRALARELHDELAQSCTAIRVEAALIAGGGPAGEAARRIDVVAAGLGDRVRTMLQRLRPADLDALGLVDAIQTLCEEWELRSGVACVFHHDAGLRIDAEPARIAVYRIVQEALTNVVKHAEAQHVSVLLTRKNESVSVMIEDDGKGFEPGSEPGGGLGLLGMQERVALLDGSLVVESTPGAGTTLVLEVPLP
jgi:signal transduction histidine kinase